MIINKVKPFYTDEDKEYINERLEIIAENSDRIAEVISKGEKGLSTQELFNTSADIVYLYDIQQKAVKENAERRYIVEQRYIASFYDDNIQGVLADVAEILDAVEKYNYTEYNELQKKVDEYYASLVSNADGKKRHLTAHPRGYKNCVKFLCKITGTQRIALYYIHERITGEHIDIDAEELPPVEGIAELDALIDAKAQSFYKKPKGAIAPATPKTPVIRTKKPELYISPIDIVSNKTFKHTGDIGEYHEQKNGQLVLREALDAVKADKKRNPVKTIWSIAYEGAEFNKPLTQYDRTVFNTIISHLKAGNRYISLKMIYETLTGKTATRESSLDDLRQSIDKMRTTMVKIDYTEEVGTTIDQAFTNEKNGRYYIRDNVLSLTEAVENINGAETNVYFLNTTPPLFRYAESKNQLASEPIEILNIPVNSSKNNLAIREYLYNRIKAMKHAKKPLSKDIKFSSIIDAVQEGSKAKINTTRIVTVCQRILDYWVTMEFIDSYTTGKNRFTIACKKNK